MKLIDSRQGEAGHFKRLNPLTLSEIESLRQETKQDIKWAQEQLRIRKVQKAEKQG